MCTFRILKAQERKIEREERLSRAGTLEHPHTDDNKNNDEYGDTLENNGDHGINYNENEEVEEDAKSIREEEDKEMEEMNKANQVISCENFKRVMSMVGRVLINLGLIYFLQFYGVNTLLVRICDREDIYFLKTGCSANGNVYRKGKFEFVNLSYQVGMFLSKTLIKLVRKIQPIEVYTIAILIVNIIYIIEYFLGIFHWYLYLVFGLIMGFFSGGTYSGGFYTILNSDKVQKNYKELTVNIATIFNDTGTFLSGILGFITYKYILNSEEPFGDKPTGECPK
jgi:hypothetical protein